MNCDVLIIGGGVIGLSIARELHKKRVGSITVVDKGRVGAEASWAAAGMLAPNVETHADDAFFRFCTESNGLYPTFAAELLEETGVDIELDRSGTLLVGFDDDDVAEIVEKFRWQSGAGIAVEHLSAEEIRKREPSISPNVKTGLLYPDDWQVENRKLIEALRKYSEHNQIRLIEEAAVDELIIDNQRVVGANAAGHEFRAETTILAAGAWTSNVLGDKTILGSEVKPVRGQMISFRPGPKRILQRVVYSPRGYVVPRADGRILVGATVEDVGFSKEVTEDAISSLREAAMEIAPAIAAFDIKEAWAGLRPFAADGMPLIGNVPGVSNLFVATAHYRNGILLAPITARVVSNFLLSGERSEYLDAFGPKHSVSAVGS